MPDSILVFGGGVLQLSIVDRARRMGYRTIVIDPNPHAIAKESADQFIVVDGNDFEKTKLICLEYNVKGIVTAATDNPILMMCRIAHDLNLTFPSFDSCDTLLDKGKFKTFLRKYGLPHANGYIYNNLNAVDPSRFIYPVIVKPVRNSGSRGVLKCELSERLYDTISETLQFCKDGRFIVEEYIVGDEISVEAIVIGGKVQIIQITDKIVTLPPYNVELGHIQPSKFLYLIEPIHNLLQEIVDRTGLNNCAIHPELKIKNDQITIIEIGPRLGGDYITSHLVPLSTGVNIEDAVIKIATNQSVIVDSNSCASMVSYLNLPIGTSIISLISELELKVRFPELVEFKLDLDLGDIVHPITNSLNRYGYFILRGSSCESLLIKRKEIEQFLFTVLV